jgi:hypothetical protein
MESAACRPAGLSCKAETRRHEGTASRQETRHRRSLARIIIKAKRLKLNHAYVGEINTAMVIIVNKAPLTVAENDKRISSIPQDTSVPTALAEDASSGVDARPR